MLTRTLLTPRQQTASQKAKLDTTAHAERGATHGDTRPSAVLLRPHPRTGRYVSLHLDAKNEPARKLVSMLRVTVVTLLGSAVPGGLRREGSVSST